MSIKTPLRSLFLTLVVALVAGVSTICDVRTSYAEGTLSRVKTAGVLKVGIASDPPYAFQDPSGEWQSFNPSLIAAFGKYLGVRVEFVSTSWTTIVAGLQANKYDLIGASINATPERQAVIAFSKPYGATGTSFLIRKDNKKALTSLSDMNKQEVVITFVTGTDNDEATHQFLPKATYRAIPNGSISDLIAELESGRSDALATSSYLVKPLSAKFPYRVLPEDENGVLPVGICWGLAKDDADLLASVNTFLDKEDKDGSLERLRSQWLTIENSLK